MAEDDILDPRVVPRWMEVGVSGVPRRREWDLVTTVELGELEGSGLDELAFGVLDDGTVVGDAPPTVVAAVREGLDRALVRPYDVRATRRGRVDWTVAAREIRLETVPLPAGLEAQEITLAIGPDGSRTLLVDGVETAAPSGRLLEAAAELERRGRQRSAAFAARAERLAEGRWTLTVDPL